MRRAGKSHHVLGTLQVALGSCLAPCHLAHGVPMSRKGPHHYKHFAIDVGRLSGPLDGACHLPVLKLCPEGVRSSVKPGALARATPGNGHVWGIKMPKESPEGSGLGGPGEGKGPPQGGPEPERAGGPRGVMTQGSPGV